jgi:hypothetical protein
MVSEEHYELLSSAVKKAWERLSSGELTEAALLEQAAGSAAEALRDEFLTTMNTHNTPSWQVRVVLDGVRVPPYHYSTNKHLKVGHFDVVERASLNRYFQRGATVMLDDAQTAIPAIDRLCTGLTAESGVPAAGTIFASPPHAEGFALHQDAEDVVIVQLAGAKSWTVFPPLSRRESSMLNRAECGDPVIESQLRAGDILLLPKGSPHKTASNSADGSVHLTLGFYPVTLRDVVLKLIQRSPDPRLDEPVPHDLREVSRMTSSWLKTAFGAADSEDLPHSLASLVEELRAGLRGDTSYFQLPSSRSHAEGGTYRLLTKVSKATHLFLAAQLNRPDDEGLGTLISALATKEHGDTFTYSEFAAAVQDGLVAQEVLHTMLRMRFISHVWSQEGEG